MPKLIIMPHVEDITYFLSGGTNKATNDESNKIRENDSDNDEKGSMNNDSEHAFMDLDIQGCNDNNMELILKSFASIKNNNDTNNIIVNNNANNNNNNANNNNK